MRIKPQEELVETTVLALTELGYRSVEEYQAKTLAKANDGKGYPLNVWSNYVENYNKKLIRDILKNDGYILGNTVTAKAYLDFNKPENEKRLRLLDLVIYEDKGRIWINPRSHNYSMFRDYIAKRVKDICSSHYNNDVRCNSKVLSIYRVTKRLDPSIKRELREQNYPI